jgi:hypothetical protein
MREQLLFQVGVQNFDVVVRQNQMVAPALANAVVVSFGEGLGISYRDDLRAWEKPSVPIGDGRQLCVIDTADDDGDHLTSHRMRVALVHSVIVNNRWMT